MSGLRDSASNILNSIIDDPFVGELPEIKDRLGDIINPPTINDPTGLEQSVYDFTYRVFPSDLTMEDNSHYMVLNINVPTTSRGASRSAFPSNILPNEFSKVDDLRFGNIAGTGAQREALSIPRNTRRIAESIALSMPAGGLVYTEDNTYEPVSMTGLMGSAVTSAASLSGLLGTIVGVTGSVVQNGSKIAGYPINPRVEVLFANRPQRQWMFEMFMAPRSLKEAQTAKEIIRTLRFYSAPEIDQKTHGFTFVPPAEFDITFFRGGIENTNLPRINTCVLERLDIDYAPQGGTYSAFRSGHPVAIRLSMGFREVEILHKRRVAEGF